MFYKLRKLIFAKKCSDDHQYMHFEGRVSEREESADEPEYSNGRFHIGFIQYYRIRLVKRVVRYHMSQKGPQPYSREYSAQPMAAKSKQRSELRHGSDASDLRPDYRVRDE